MQNKLKKLGYLPAMCDIDPASNLRKESGELRAGCADGFNYNNSICDGEGKGFTCHKEMLLTL
jgi:hypothetical protein